MRRTQAPTAHKLAGLRSRARSEREAGIVSERKRGRAGAGGAAKISRPEVAAHFMSPPPKVMVEDLLQRGWITTQEAHLAQYISVAEDCIVESDSGGHTDNQALSALFPTIVQLRDRISREHQFQRPIHLGAAGGLGPARHASLGSMPQAPTWRSMTRPSWHGVERVCDPVPTCLY